jgi:cobyrinic acid a,c-diamide synthase
VNTESHYRFLKEACEDVGVEPLGYVPVNDNIKIPSRHLGLNIADECDYDRIADHISKTVDVERLLEITTTTSSITQTYHTPQTGTLKIAIAKDEAFNFTYYENIEVLKQMGEVTFFSPVHDNVLPETDLLYLAGGYPELYLEALSGNTPMREKILDYCNNGGRVIAECGGMMYLGKSITDKEGNSYPMAGFLDITTSMEQAKLTLGYRTVTINDRILKGHEFHYSTYNEERDLLKIGEVHNAKGIKVNTPIYRQKNVTASYIHFYWGEHQSNNALEAFLSTLNASSK